MAKQSISRKETQVSTGDSVGKQLEQTVSVDDNSLPSPQELSQYQKISPNIVEFLIETARKEQEHRHYMEKEKLELIKESEQKDAKMNIRGMRFAFLSLVIFMGITAFALYLDKPWFSGIFGAITILSIMSIFVEVGKKPKKEK